MNHLRLCRQPPFLSSRPVIIILLGDYLLRVTQSVSLEDRVLTAVVITAVLVEDRSMDDSYGPFVLLWLIKDLGFVFSDNHLETGRSRATFSTKMCLDRLIAWIYVTNLICPTVNWERERGRKISVEGKKCGVGKIIVGYSLTMSMD